MQNSGSPHLDLTGKLIIKVALGDDIRRIPIHNEDITYDELVLMMQRVYRGKLSTNDDIAIKYKDEVDGGKSMLESPDTASIRKELQDIRDRVISLLDKLEHSRLIGATQSFNISDAVVETTADPARQNAVAPPNGAKIPNAVGGKEFDPLKSQISTEDTSKVMSSFGIENNAPSAPSQSQYDRAATPDSISSIGSSASNQIRAQQNAQQNATGPQHAVPPQQPGAPQQPQRQQQQPQSMPYPGQPGYNPNQQGQIPQGYAGQPGFGGTSMPGQPSNQPPQQQQQQQPHDPQAPSQQAPQGQQQPPGSQHQQQPYDPAMYNAYNQNPGFQPAPGQPGQGQMMYGQPGGLPNAYGQAPGMPQAQQPKAPSFPQGPQGPPAGQSPGNPYSRGGPSYGAGYPRPASGYPQ